MIINAFDSFQFISGGLLAVREWHLLMLSLKTYAVST